MSPLTQYMQLVASAHALPKNFVFHGSYASNWETLQQYCMHDSVYLQNIPKREGIQMSNFKVGDKVQRVYGNSGGMEVGDIGTISKVLTNGQDVELVEWPDVLHLVSRLELVQEGWIKLLSDAELITLWVATRLYREDVKALHERIFDTAGTLLTVHTLIEFRLFCDLDNELDARGIDSSTGKKAVTKTRVIPEHTEEYTEHVPVNEL